MPLTRNTKPLDLLHSQSRHARSPVIPGPDRASLFILTVIGLREARDSKPSGASPLRPSHAFGAGPSRSCGHGRPQVWSSRASPPSNDSHPKRVIKCMILNYQLVNHTLDLVQHIFGRGLAIIWTRSLFTRWTWSNTCATQGRVGHTQWTWSKP